jgi:uncharacterized protein YjbJ (UPF0337 family)
MGAFVSEIRNKAERAKEKFEGKAKEVAGKVTRDEKLEAEGKSQLKKEQAKEAVEDAVDKVQDAAGKMKKMFK